MTIDIDPALAEAIQRLQSVAAARKIPAAQMIDVLLQSSGNAFDASQQLGPAEIDAVLDELADQTEPHPSLPDDFSRADVYQDHD